jgi:hypothetical protein
MRAGVGSGCRSPFAAVLSNPSLEETTRLRRFALQVGTLRAMRVDGPST